MSSRKVVVIGAGPAGLSTALSLKDQGIRPLVLDRADTVASSWRTRYDRLKLNSPRGRSHLAGRRFPKGTPVFPSRDQMIAHLEQGAAEDGLEIRLNTEVTRIDHTASGWTIQTSDGPIETDEVVVATGFEHTPQIPEWPGRETFTGELIHAAEYRNPDPYRGRRVLVVGCGCSGMEIAYDLAEGGAAEVWMAVRTAPNIVLRTGPGGIPGDWIAGSLLRTPKKFADAAARFGRKMDMGDLSEFGLPVPEEGVFSRLERLKVAPAIVDKEVIEAIKARRFTVVKGVVSFDATGVSLADGRHLEPHAVVCATGYRRDLESLVGHLGVLDDQGIPRVKGEPAAPGLRFVGYTARPAMVGFAAKEAQRAAKAIAAN